MRLWLPPALVESAQRMGRVSHMDREFVSAEVVNELLEVLREVHEQTCGNIPTSQLGATSKKVRAAIAKAREAQ